MKLNLSKKVAGYFLLKNTSRFYLAGSLVFVSSVYAAEPVSASSVNERLDRIERIINNQNLIDMYTSLQTLKQEVSSLRGDMELFAHELKNLKQQQKDLYVDIDQRMQDIEKSVTSLTAIPPAPGFESSGVSTPSAAVDSAVVGQDVTQPPNAGLDSGQDTLSEQESYQGALSVLKSGRYEEAIQGFQVFLINYPTSTFAANAQYWMAEAYYVLKNFETAIVQFKKVITAYPDSSKVADAYLKMGFSFYELHDWNNAQQALEKVLSDFSSSTAARLAQRRLQQMKLEGHI